MFISVDPGPVKTAYVHLSGGIPIKHGILSNADMLAHLHSKHGQTDVVIEMIASYGLAVGVEVFETCFFIGRFYQTSIVPAHRLFRSEIKMHLCNSMRAKDANIRQALIDRFGGKERSIGNKANPGPLHGVKADVWAALAVAVTFFDRQPKEH